MDDLTLTATASASEGMIPNQVTLPMNQLSTTQGPVTNAQEPVTNIQKPVTNAQDSQQEPQETQETQEVQDVQEAAEAAGVDFNAIEQEFLSTGAVSEETQKSVVDAFAEKGIPEAQVRKFFRNLDAEKELMTLKAHQIAGGEEAFNEMCEWAQANIPEAERQTLMTLFQTEDKEKALSAVKFIHNQFKMASQTGGDRLKATNGGTPVGPLFRSQAELAAAFSDPEVAKSPTKQAEIRKRLELSLAQGTLRA